MAQGSRPDRVADQIRAELAMLISREVHDPGIGFLTITRVQMTPDLQLARVYYTALSTSGSEAAAKANTAKALGRAASFLRRRIGQTLRLRKTPTLEFFYDESIAGQDRIEQLLNEIKAAPASLPDNDDNPGTSDNDDDQ